MYNLTYLHMHSLSLERHETVVVVISGKGSQRMGKMGERETYFQIYRDKQIIHNTHYINIMIQLYTIKLLMYVYNYIYIH